MLILCVLDKEGGVDSGSLIGRMVIAGFGGRIDESDVYLDSWLAALIEGVSAAERGERKTVEMLEEPVALSFEPMGEGFRLTYGADILTIEKTEAFRDLLILACCNFLSEVKSVIGSDSSELIAGIKSYVDSLKGEPKQRS